MQSRAVEGSRGQSRAAEGNRSWGEGGGCPADAKKTGAPECARSDGGGGDQPPPREDMMEISGMKRAMTMVPTTTARKMISIGSMIEVMEATALSMSSS